MSSDVMQHELVERARESGTLTKADITKAWFIYWLGGYSIHGPSDRKIL